jgi:hypothetical protein
MSGTPADRAGTGGRSWLPRDRAERLSADAPVWVPQGFAGKPIPWPTLSYIVVDELSREVAGLVVASWPRLDPKGRVRFSGSSWRVGARLDELDALLDAQRNLPETPPGSEPAWQRPVRIGDAFAAQVVRPRGRSAAVPALSRWLSAPIYDVSADARDAAKAALYGALAPTMSEDEVIEIAAEALDLTQ